MDRFLCKSERVECDITCFLQVSVSVGEHTFSGRMILHECHSMSLTV